MNISCMSKCRILDGNPLHEITGDGVFASLTSLLEL